MKMKTIRQIIQQWYPDIRQTLIAGIIGLSISLSVYLGLLQRHFFSWTYLGYALIIAVLGFLLAGWLNQHLIRRFLTDTPTPTRIFALVFSFVLGFLLLFSTKIQPLYYFLPDTDLEIRFTIPELPAQEEGVRLLWVNTGQDNIHYSAIKVEGKWERIFGNSIFAPGQSVALHWQGKAGPKTEIAFRRTNYSQPVEVIWNGISRSYDLKDGEEANIFIRSHLDVALVYRLPFILAFILAAGYALLAALIALSTWDPGARQHAHSRKVRLAAVHAAHAAGLGSNAGGFLAGHHELGFHVTVGDGRHRPLQRLAVRVSRHPSGRADARLVFTCFDRPPADREFCAGGRMGAEDPPGARRSAHRLVGHQPALRGLPDQRHLCHHALEGHPVCHRFSLADHIDH